MKKVKLFNQNMTDQELLDDLKKIAMELNKDTISKRMYDENDKSKYHSNTIIKRFTAWNNAIEKAGLIVKYKQNISDEELLMNIAEVWNDLGRQPGKRDMNSSISKSSVGRYVNAFGSWNKSLIAFDSFINDIEIDTEKTIKNKTEILPRHKTRRDPNLRLRFLVMRRDNFKCSCGRSPSADPTIVLHIDHIVAWDKGGETVYENLQTLCSDCNYGKSNLDMKE